jgi:hypothetical protein
MNSAIEELVRKETTAKGLSLDPTFFPKADAYISRHFAASSSMDKMIIESYLSQAAIRIGATI